MKHLQQCCTAERLLEQKRPPRLTVQKEKKVGGHRECMCTHLLFISTTKLSSPPLVNPPDSQQDWAAGQTVKRKRGRKPKVVMGVDANRAHHKDSRASEKQEVRGEKSDCDSSEHGELQ